MSEQRRSERFPINEEFSSLGDESGLTYVSDLSTHGVFIHTRHNIGIGVFLDLRFTLVLDDPVIIEARGRVVRLGDNGVGIEFTDLRPDMVLRIHDAVARQRAAAEDEGGLSGAEVDARSAGGESFDDKRTNVYPAVEMSAADLEAFDQEAFDQEDS